MTKSFDVAEDRKSVVLVEISKVRTKQITIKNFWLFIIQYHVISYKYLYAYIVKTNKWAWTVDSWGQIRAHFIYLFFVKTVSESQQWKDFLWMSQSRMFEQLYYVAVIMEALSINYVASVRDEIFES